MGAADGIRAGKAFVEVGAKDTTAEPLARIEKRFKAFGAAAAEVGQKFLAAGASFSAPLVLATRTFTSMGDAVAKASTRTGIGVEALSGLSYAATQSGTSAETLEQSLGHMAKTLSEASSGSKEARDKLEDLGITLKDIDGLSPDEVFKVIATQISKIDDPLQKSAAAMEIFGRSGKELLPLMEGGKVGIDELVAAGERLGLVMSTKDARAAEELGDRFDDLWKVLKMGVFNVGAALVPMMHDAAAAITDVAVRVSDWIKENKGLIAHYGTMIAQGALWAAGIGAAAFAIGKLATAAGGLIAVGRQMVIVVQAARAALTVLAANPAILAFTALAGVVGLVAYAMQQANTEAAQLSDSMSRVTARNDEARQVDVLRLQRLAQLSDADKLNGEQMKEASSLIGALTSRYGELGLSIDKATGKLVVQAGAWEKVGQQMQAATLKDLDSQIAQHKANIAAINRDMGQFKGKIQLPTEDFNRLQGYKEKLPAEQLALEAAQMRRAALAGGDLDAILSPKDEATKLRSKLSTPLNSEQIAARKQSEEASKRLAEINEQLDAKERTQLENEVAEVRKLANEKMSLLAKLEEGENARRGGARAAELEKFAADRIDTEEKAAARIGEIYDKAAEEHQKKEDEGFREKLRQIEEEQRAAREAHREEVQRGDYLLDLKEQLATGAGDTAGAAKIKAERFRNEQAERISDLGLEGQDKITAQSAAAEIARRMEQIMPTIGVVGTFNSSALGQIAGGGGPAEQTARNTADLKTILKQGVKAIEKLEPMKWG